MKTKNKIILGTSIAVATATTLLFTTKTGKKIRKELCKQSDDILEAAKAKFEKETEIRSFDDVANKIMDFAVKNKDSIAGVIAGLFSKK